MEKEAAEVRDARKRIRLLEQEMRVVAGQRRSSPGRCPNMKFPLVRDLAADGIPVATGGRLDRYRL